LQRQILEFSPPPISGISESMSAVLNGCLEKDRDHRWQRMNSILIELKLATASLVQAHSAAAWKEELMSLRSHIAAQDERLAASQLLQEFAVDELRSGIQQIGATVAGIEEAIAGLQRGSQAYAKAIECLQVAASQTDEVVEHVVEAFGLMHKSMTERGDPKSHRPSGD
jgi:hypothetical protein